MSHHFPNRPISSTAPQGQSPLAERAKARLDMRTAADRTRAVIACHERIGVALAELIELGVNPLRLDLFGLAEAGQQLRRARAL